MVYLKRKWGEGGKNLITVCYSQICDYEMIKTGKWERREINLLETFPQALGIRERVWAWEFSLRTCWAPEYFRTIWNAWFPVTITLNCALRYTDSGTMYRDDAKQDNTASYAFCTMKFSHKKNEQRISYQRINSIKTIGQNRKETV